MDQLGLGHGKGDVDWGGLSLECREGHLKEADVSPVGGRGHGESEVSEVGENK